mmetsp:Transcript_10532/g.26101  ORF Transcript_10532/g.26101 Transcript_10532/m.26101 type:complete len:292 (+) Transcript_10532:225-1100(+)
MSVSCNEQRRTFGFMLDAESGLRSSEPPCRMPCRCSVPCVLVLGALSLAARRMCLGTRRVSPLARAHPGGGAAAERSGARVSRPAESQVSHTEPHLPQPVLPPTEFIQLAPHRRNRATPSRTQPCHTIACGAHSRLHMPRYAPARRTRTRNAVVRRRRTTDDDAAVRRLHAGADDRRHLRRLLGAKKVGEGPRGRVLEGDVELVLGHLLHVLERGALGGGELLEEGAQLKVRLPVLGRRPRRVKGARIALEVGLGELVDHLAHRLLALVFLERRTDVLVRHLEQPREAVVG